MKHESMRIVDGEIVYSDTLGMHLTDILERGSSYAVAHAVNQPGATHHEWLMEVRDVIDFEGRVYRLEGAVRITESTSQEESAAWKTEARRYWDSLSELQERDQEHGSE